MNVLLEYQNIPLLIYTFECGDFVKIGISHCPWERVRNLPSTSGKNRRIDPRRTITPDGLDINLGQITAMVRGTTDEELELHRRLASHKVTGEWYYRTCLRTKAYRIFFGQREHVEPHVRTAIPWRINADVVNRASQAALAEGIPAWLWIERALEEAAVKTEATEEYKELYAQ